MENKEKKSNVTTTEKIQKVDKIPKDELAVTDSLTLTTPNMPNFASLVLPEETAEEPEEKKNSLARYRELGFFSPIRGMTNISNRLDGKLYAKLYENEKGERYIEYVQKYIDGSFSPKMSLPQAGMRIAAQYKFSSKGIEEPKIRNRVSDFILEAHEDYYGKFSGVLADELNIANILAVLYEALPHLPLISDKVSELEEETLYQIVSYHINNLTSWSAHEHRSYYALEENDIDTLAVSMEMKKQDLLNMLKHFDLLYLTPSSRGYQSNVRIKGIDGSTYTEWRYCIYKLSFMAGIEEENSNIIKPGENF